MNSGGPSTAASDAVFCHRCAYDLRAHPSDGICPECGASVAESRKLAANPVRPAWRDSDPRWRRRILAGVWLLLLMPLLTFLRRQDLLEKIPALGFFPLAGVGNLGDTLLATPFIYEPLVFCMGAVLLFSGERDRRRAPFDWTRKWGIAGSYLVLFVSAAEILFLFALVLVGIGALLQSIPPKYQPGITPLVVNVGSSYLRYGPHPSDRSTAACIAFSALTVLLTLFPLHNALRSCGSARAAGLLLAPIAVGAAYNLTLVARVGVGLLSLTPLVAYLHELFFIPEAIFPEQYRQYGSAFGAAPVPAEIELRFEQLKWLALLAITLRLTVAQFLAGAHRRRRHREDALASPAQPQR